MNLSAHIGDIEHQLYLRSCGAHAGTTALEMLLSMQGKKVELDRTYLYAVLRHMAGYGDEDKGARLADVPKALKEGVPESSLMWDDVLYIWRTITGFWKRKPKTRKTLHRISEYGVAHSIEAAIDECRPVIAGLNIREAFKLPDFVGYSKSPIYDKHIVVVVGYSEHHFLIVNSWGRCWGDEGTAWMPKHLFNEDCYGKWWVK